jgi:hypothetical protein
MRLQDVSVASIGLGAPSIAVFAQGRIDPAVLAGSAITSVKHRFPNLAVLSDARTAEGVQLIYGIDMYPAHDLLARTERLKKKSSISTESGGCDYEGHAIHAGTLS